MSVPFFISNIKQHLRQPATMVPVIFFLLILFIGLMSYRNYGVPWDEGAQRSYGDAVYEYVVHGDRSLLQSHERFHGPAFEFALTTITRLAGSTDMQDVEYTRHLITFLLFFAGAVCFFFLARRMTRFWMLALLGTAFLLLSPKIIADAFFNTKDLPALSLGIIGLLTLMRFLERSTLSRVFVHAFICALLIDVRLAGGIIVPLTIVGLSCVFWSQDRGAARRTCIFSCAMYIVTVTLLAWLFWPTLWEFSLSSIAQAISENSRFPWTMSVLYWGRDISALELPWHYAPVWIAITTPVLYLMLAIVGWCAIIFRTVRHFDLRDRRLQQFWIVLLWFFAPITAVIALHSTLYDGWRHLYFIYPGLLLAAIIGLEWLWIMKNSLPLMLRRPARTAIIGFVALNLLGTAAFMVRAHPHQQVYFNALVGGIRGAQHKFELDYWGLSYRAGLALVMAADQRPQVMIAVANNPGKLNIDMLPAAERLRVSLVDTPEDADYFLTNYRWHDDPYPYPLWRTVDVEGVPILGIYKIR